MKSASHVKLRLCIFSSFLCLYICAIFDLTWSFAEEGGIFDEISFLHVLGGDDPAFSLASRHHRDASRAVRIVVDPVHLPCRT